MSLYTHAVSKKIKILGNLMRMEKFSKNIGITISIVWQHQGKHLKTTAGHIYLSKMDLQVAEYAHR